MKEIVFLGTEIGHLFENICTDNVLPFVLKYHGDQKFLKTSLLTGDQGYKIQSPDQVPWTIIFCLWETIRKIDIKIMITNHSENLLFK